MDETVKANIVQWADRQADIRLVVLVGSRAREQHPASKYADLDLLIFTDSGHHYFDDKTWLNDFGDVLLSVEGRTAGGDPEVMTVYAGYQGVDFVFVPAKALATLSELDELPDIFLKGYSVWVDKEEIGKKIETKRWASQNRLKAFPPPSQSEYDHAVGSFLFGAYYVGRVLYQGDRWLAKARQSELNYALLKMIEWHARVKKGWALDVWHMGKYIQEWAEPNIVAKIPALFSDYDKQHSFTALLNTVDVFEQMASEVSQSLCYLHDTDKFKQIRAFILDMQDESL
jgi:aminoglycoside 6-adenylyltransferase